MLQFVPAKALRRLGQASAFLLLGAVALVPNASAQDPDLTVAVGGLTPDNWPAPQAVVTVLDADERPLASLNEANFTVQFDGQTVPVAAVEQGLDSSLAIDVVLALDTSNSMAGDPLEQAKMAARSFLAELSQEDAVAVITFDDAVELIQPYTIDRTVATAAIDSVSAGGGTALYQATSESLRLAAGAGSGREVVVLLSDGLDNGSTDSRESAQAAAETMGVPIFAIGLGADIDVSYLEALAELSGGRFVATPSPEGLAAVFQEAAELLRGQYILTLDTSGLEVDRSRVATLHVTVESDGAISSDERAVCPQHLCLSLHVLETGENAGEEFTVIAEVMASQPVSVVTFSVDGVAAQDTLAPPYQFAFQPGLYSDGAHLLSVQATTTGEETMLQEITLGAASGGGLAIAGILPMAGVAVAAIVVVALVVLYVRGREDDNALELPDLRPDAPSAAPNGESGPRQLSDEPSLPPLKPEQPGRLVVTGGSLSGESFPVSDAPLSIGSGLRCAIRLPEGSEGVDDVGVEHVRVWVRHGQLMVHQVRRLTAYGATGGGWEILRPGDAFEVGPTTIRFELLGEDGEALPEPEPELPNILRSKPDSPSAGKSDAEGAREGSPPPASDVPNIFRSKDDSPSGAKSEAQGAQETSATPSSDVPNILRSKEDRAFGADRAAGDRNDEDTP